RIRGTWSTNCARANEATALTLGSSSTATRQRASMDLRCLFKRAAIRAYSECGSGAIAGPARRRSGATDLTLRQTSHQASLDLSVGTARPDEISRDPMGLPGGVNPEGW